MTRLENRYIILVWWAAFMLITPWDQEKIVVLNLVVFCYFLYYMLSESIASTFEQRKDTIRSVLISQLQNRVTVLNTLLSEISKFVVAYNNLTLSLIAKLKLNASMISSPANYNSSSNIELYSSINRTLDKLAQEALSYNYNKNLLTSQLLIISEKPTADTE